MTPSSAKDITADITAESIADANADHAAAPDPQWSYRLGAALRAQRRKDTTWRLRLLDGPNMSNLGKGAGSGGRDPRTYGAVTSLAALQQSMVEMARGLGTLLQPFESYHEADFLAHIYDSATTTDAYLINPAALTRFGVPLKQAFRDAGRPFVELHFSNISAIGWSNGGATTPAANAVVMGLRHYSYLGALLGLVLSLDDGSLESAGVRVSQ